MTRPVIDHDLHVNTVTATVLAMTSTNPRGGGQRSERPRCPVDPTHYEDAHAPGGSWYGVPHRFGDKPAGRRALTTKLRAELVMELEGFVGQRSLVGVVEQIDALIAAARAENG